MFSRWKKPFSLTERVGRGLEVMEMQSPSTPPTKAPSHPPPLIFTLKVTFLQYIMLTQTSPAQLLYWEFWDSFATGRKIVSPTEYSFLCGIEKNRNFHWRIPQWNEIRKTPVQGEGGKGREKLINMFFQRPISLVRAPRPVLAIFKEQDA